MESWKLERLKYCRIGRVNGELKYYVMNGNCPVEVTKDVYLVIEHTYHKEWLMEHGRQSDWVSLEQIAEDEETLDRHGHMPQELQTPSAEDIYFAPVYEEHRKILSEQVKQEIETLQDEQRALAFSFIEDNGIINELSERDNVSVQAIYQRRETVRKSIAKKLKGADEDE